MRYLQNFKDLGLSCVAVKLWGNSVEEAGFEPAVA